MLQHDHRSFAGWVCEVGSRFRRHLQDHRKERLLRRLTVEIGMYHFCSQPLTDDREFTTQLYAVFKGAIDVCTGAQLFSCTFINHPDFGIGDPFIIRLAGHQPEGHAVTR